MSDDPGKLPMAPMSELIDDLTGEFCISKMMNSAAKLMNFAFHCILNDEFCSKTDEFCIENDELLT